jgi:hypothetical protein
MGMSWLCMVGGFLVAISELDRTYLHRSVGCAVTCATQCETKGGWKGVVGDSRGCLTFYSPLGQTGKVCVDEDAFSQDPNFCRLVGIVCVESVKIDCGGGIGVEFVVCCVGDCVVFLRGLRKDVTLKLPCVAYAVCIKKFDKCRCARVYFRLVQRLCRSWLPVRMGVSI